MFKYQVSRIQTEISIICLLSKGEEHRDVDVISTFRLCWHCAASPAIEFRTRRSGDCCITIEYVPTCLFAFFLAVY